MERPLYRSIEELIQPATLSLLTQRPITKAWLAPFQPAGWSSTESDFFVVETDDAAAPRYVLKRMVRERDWVMQATEDHHGRAAAIWQHGLLDSLPEQIDHAAVACASDEWGCAILMHDVSEALVPEHRPLSEADEELNLGAMAALHAAFWDAVEVHDPALQLCSPEHLFTHTAPQKIRRAAMSHTAPVLGMILEGWRVLRSLVDSDVAELLQALAADPRPLCTALAGYPQTLIHGDWRLANIGYLRGAHPRLVLLDWARPTCTGAAVELAYYLVTSARQMPHSPERTIELYKQQLARRLEDRFQETWWQPQMALGLLGAFLMIGCFKAWGAVHAPQKDEQLRREAELVWWTEQARAGAKWLLW